MQFHHISKVGEAMKEALALTALNITVLSPTKSADRSDISLTKINLNSRSTQALFPDILIGSHCVHQRMELSELEKVDAVAINWKKLGAKMNIFGQQQQFCQITIFKIKNEC